MKLPSIQQLKNDLKGINYEIVVYGSYATGDWTFRSDIDIAIITRVSDPLKNKKIWKSLLGSVPDRYHLNVFELLPLHIKAEIINTHKVIAGDTISLSEYFYHFRSLWKDSSHRYFENQFSSVHEKRTALKEW